MKYWILLCALLVTGTATQAQNKNKGTNTQKNNAAAHTGMDHDFVVKAGESGKAEVMLGNLAEAKGASQAVKDFGAMMVMDHQKANDELITLAARKRYMTVAKDLPADMQKDYNNLNAKSGADFDKAFMVQMVKDHEKAIRLFRDEAANGKDPDLKNWAAQTLPALEQHLQHAKSVQQQVESGDKGSMGNHTGK
jgi:putative membrane protein